MVIFTVVKIGSQIAKFALDLIQKTYQSHHSADKKETSSREWQRQMMEQYLFFSRGFHSSFLLSLVRFQKPTSFLMSSSASRSLSGPVIMIWRANINFTTKVIFYFLLNTVFWFSFSLSTSCWRWLVFYFLLIHSCWCCEMIGKRELISHILASTDQ